MRERDRITGGIYGTILTDCSGEQGSVESECEHPGCGTVADLQQVINSSLGLRMVSVFAQKLPPPIGYWIASGAARYIARKWDSNLVQAIRANQWVIHGEGLNRAALDQAVRENLKHSARCIFDLYHYIHDPEAAGNLITLEPSFERLSWRPEFGTRGLIILGLHLSNFDLVLQWICRLRMKPLVLTIPDPQGGRRVEYELRRRTGINLLPASVGAIRQALKHLQQGGMVLTGIDRPIPGPEARPLFFGRPAALPIHHIFLATRAHVPLVIAIVRFQGDGKYHVYASDFIEMEPYPDPELEALRNAEKVLNIAEGFIRHAPHQWTVPLPVWPEVMELLPK